MKEYFRVDYPSSSIRLASGSFDYYSDIYMWDTSRRCMYYWNIDWITSVVYDSPRELKEHVSKRGYVFMEITEDKFNCLLTMKELTDV